MLKILIADDNEGMRLVLRKAVEKAGHEVVGEALSGVQAVALCETLRPHVIFMDIDLPVLNGIEASRKIQDIDPKTFIVFATAHEEYRKEAFELYAYDYLVKPFEIRRIADTLNRISQVRSGKLDQPIKPTATIQTAQKLLIRHKEGINLVDMADIILIQRENRQTVIYTASQKHISNETLSELEQRLPINRFFRCHKSYIINLDKVIQIYPYGRWTYIVKLKDTQLDALMTQERFATFQSYFG